MAWTERQIEVMTELAPSLSAKQIGDIIGQTRNAVIGKLRRIGVSLWKGGGMQHGVAPVKKATAATPKPKPLPQPRAAPVVVKFEPVTLIELSERNCKWPLGDPKQPSFRFCGAARLSDRAYCRAHYEASLSPLMLQRRLAS